MISLLSVADTIACSWYNFTSLARIACFFCVTNLVSPETTGELRGVDIEIVAVSVLIVVKSYVDTNIYRWPLICRDETDSAHFCSLFSKGLNMVYIGLFVILLISVVGNIFLISSTVIFENRYPTISFLLLLRFYALPTDKSKNLYISKSKKTV